MTTYSPPPVELVPTSLTLGDRVVDLTTRALVIAHVPNPAWARESEVIAAVRAAADAGADLAEVPAEPRLLGPAAQAGGLPVAARASTDDGARAARAAGAALVLASAGLDEAQVTVVEDAVAARDVRASRAAPEDEPLVALDARHLAGADLVAETSLALSVGARFVCTDDIRRVRRVVEVMAALLEARR